MSLRLRGGVSEYVCCGDLILSISGTRSGGRAGALGALPALTHFHGSEFIRVRDAARRRQSTAIQRYDIVRIRNDRLCP